MSYFPDQSSRSQNIKAELLADLEALEQEQQKSTSVDYILTRQWPKMLVALLAVVGLFIAAYLALYNSHIAAGSLICSVSGSCEDVNNSVYGFWFGIPVSVFGVIGYLALLLTSVVGLRLSGRRRLRATNLQLALATFGFAASAWFTSVEAFILGKWCQWCVASAIVMTIIFALSILDRRSVQQVAVVEEDADVA